MTMQTMQMQMEEIEAQVKQFNEAMPTEIRRYLNERFISDEIIEQYQLGYDAKIRAIVIPIKNDADAYIGFKYRRDPRQKNAGGQRYWFTEGLKVQIYGWEHLSNPPSHLVLCEGELDRLVLEGQGIAAITATCGAGSKFEQEWISQLRSIGVVYICYDRDEAGIKAAEQLAKIIPHSKIVTLPEMGEGKKDITDFFQGGHDIEDFKKLFSDARTGEEVTAKAKLSLMRFYGEAVYFNPSQEVVGDRLYFTIPLYVPNDEQSSRGKKEISPVKKTFFVIDSDRRFVELVSTRDFYDKYSFIIKQLPRVKDQESRWSCEHIGAFVNHGYTPDAFEVFQDCVRLIKKYSELKDESDYFMIAIWLMGTYTFRAFETYPYLGFTGLQGSGKSKILKILALSAFNGQQVVNISEASLFRDVESLRSTLILDECESFNDRNAQQTLRSLLNSGYSKGAKVSRQEKEGDSFVTANYDVFSPKAMANIAGFETVLGTRMIPITMLKAKSEKGSIHPSQGSDDWGLLRHKLYSFALCNFKAIRNAYLYDIKTKINNNRSNDLWSPLLSVARVVMAGRPELFEQFKTYIHEQIASAAKGGLDARVVILLGILKAYVLRDDWYQLERIRQQVAENAEPDQRETITSEWIGHKLIGLGLKNKKRDKFGMKYFIKKGEIDDLLERYRGEMSLEDGDEAADTH